MSIDVIPMLASGPEGEGLKPCRLIPDDAIISGHDHEEAIHNYFESPGGHFIAGVWESTPCKDRTVYSVDEGCFIISGKVRLTSDDGRSWLFKAGDCFVVPKGFSGTWETIETVRKFHFIHDRATG